MTWGVEALGAPFGRHVGMGWGGGGSCRGVVGWDVSCIGVVGHVGIGWGGVGHVGVGWVM